jgi:hypothetical protein
MVTRELLPWFATDAEALRRFLESETGTRLLPKILESTPGLLAGGDTNALMVRSGEVRGCQIFATAILALAYPPPPPPEEQNSYPELEDDSKWSPA